MVVGSPRRFAVLSKIMRPFSGRSTVLAAIPWLGVAAIGSGCVPRTVVKSSPRHGSGSAREQVHLVMDVGSSGTALCMFPVRVSQDGRGCTVGSVPPVCSKAKGGLAAITQGQDPAAILGLVRPRLQAAWDALGDDSKGGRLALRAQIQAVAALGTGGFRDPQTGQTLDRPEWSALWQAIGQFLRQVATIPSVVAQPISGAQEGALAWQGVREAEQPSERFAIMEVGGATVQFATADGLRSDAPVVTVSDGRGQDVTFDRFTAAGRQSGDFSVCYSPSQRERQRGQACIDLLFDQVFADARVTGLAAVTPPRRVYALGAPWLGLLRELPTVPPWQVKSSRDLPSRVRLSDLRALADWLCPKSDRQLLAIAPHSYEVIRGAGRTCYSVAYHAAYFQAIAPAATEAEVIPGGDEQWARGAAVSGEFFAACRPASDK